MKKVLSAVKYTLVYLAGLMTGIPVAISVGIGPYVQIKPDHRWYEVNPIFLLPDYMYVAVVAAMVALAILLHYAAAKIVE
jgi:hypothetical protein